MNFNFQNFSLWQQQLFAAGLLQRMLPNYAYFSNATQFGDYNLLKNQIDLVWQKISMLPLKINLEAQMDKLQAIIPELSDFDLFAVYPAIDVCTGMVCLLESLQENETQCANELSGLSENTVCAYLCFQHEQSLLSMEQTESVASKKLIDSAIETDPLFVWECEVQQELYEMVALMKPSRQNCQQVRAFVMQDRLSSLAVEY